VGVFNLAAIEFIPGQRWISNTESELGLGIVIENQNRRVSLSFPAAGETRTYAMDNAPLSRVQYPVGESIASADGQQLIVTELSEKNGCILYLGQNNNGEPAELEEIDLDSFVRFSKPQDRMFAGQIEKNSRFELRVATLEHRHSQQQSDAFGLLGGRVQLLPHQLYIASQVGHRYAPRVLLADEVGLGKTIEAGLILHQQMVTGRSSRALIIVPDSLVHQWLVEMLRRFNLRFTILDESRCQALEEPLDEDDAFFDLDQPDVETPEEIENPFETAQLVLCSLSFLTEHPQRHAQALEASWDMMIVDEAHHLTWNEQQASSEYTCIETLARKIPGLLLLTATPEQLGVEGHFARLRLLDPDRYFDIQQFCEEEAGYQPVSELVQKLSGENIATELETDSELKNQLVQYLGESATQELMLSQETEEAELSDSEEGSCFEQKIQDAIDSLLDRHGTGRVLFRNTREAVQGFPERQLHAHPLPAPDQYVAASSSATLDELLHPELLLGNELWTTTDPRVHWLDEWLAENRDEKALVICSRAETAQALEEFLRLRKGVRSAVFHEGMGLVARDRAAAYFADEDERAQVLVCSEIGSEGRNFQFARHLVLFDLPLNPDLLEQRIGRLDRIGQRHDVQIHVPFYQTDENLAISAQQSLLNWYHKGLNVFERVCPIGQSIYQQFQAPLLECLKLGDEEELATLIEQTNTKTEATLQELHNGRDRLLELNSCNTRRAELVVDDVLAATQMKELSEYMGRVFDHYGVEQEFHSADSIVLHPGEHMISHSFPGLPSDGLTGTYHRTKALSREDMQFLTWEHPMVSGAIDMVLEGDFGNTALCTVKLPPLKPGTLLLETIYTLHCPAPKQLQLHRYLHQPMVRFVVNADGKDLTKVLTFEKLNSLVKSVKMRTAVDLVRHARPEITKMIEKTDNKAEAQQADIVAAAITHMNHDQQVELQRLTALAEVNPNIRQDEIEHLQSSTESLAHYLENAQLKLDSLRVVIAV
jgi:ATP-dependent helicase HepA